jgi:hypothetical protein
MRCLRPLGIWAAGVFLLTGCGKTGISWVNSWERKLSNESRMSGERIHAATAGARRVSSGSGESGGSYRAAFGRAAPPRASDEIAVRMAHDLAEWEASKADLASAHRETPASGGPHAASNGGVTKPGVAPFDPSDLAEARRRRSVECLNSQLRVAILEQRLDSAKESEKEAISAKLVQARDDLKVVDAACVKEAILIKAGRSTSSNGNGGNGNSGGRGVEAQPAGASNAR